jgi:hypothetical protein
MNAEGTCELDASIMDGRTQDAGAASRADIVGTGRRSATFPLIFSIPFVTSCKMGWIPIPAYPLLSPLRISRGKSGIRNRCVRNRLANRK